MQYELHSIGLNGQKYDGLFARGQDENPVVMHLHGTGGNFYANRIIDRLGKLYNGLGYGYLTVNLPGYESYARNEVFEESRSAISAWREAVGARRLILQGHSLGALKALDFVKTSTEAHVVDRMMLLSPFDVVAFYADGGGNDIPARRKALSALAAREGLEASVPKTMFEYWEMSIGTTLAMMEEGGAADRFPSREPSRLAAGDWLPDLPTLIMIGGDDFAAYPSPREVVDSLPKARVEAHLIEGAPHNFDGRLDAVAEVVSAWLKRA